MSQNKWPFECYNRVFWANNNNNNEAGEEVFHFAIINGQSVFSSREIWETTAKAVQL